MRYMTTGHQSYQRGFLAQLALFVTQEREAEIRQELLTVINDARAENDEPAFATLLDALETIDASEYGVSLLGPLNVDERANRELWRKASGKDKRRVELELRKANGR